MADEQPAWDDLRVLLEVHRRGSFLAAGQGFMSVTIQAIEKVRRDHPEIFVEVNAEARFVDLAAREADIGVRGARSSSAVLIERPVGEVHAGLFASAEYLDRRLPARILTGDDWPVQDFITGDAPHGATEWLRACGAVRFPLKLSTFDGRLDAAERGMGLVLAGASTSASRPNLQRVRVDPPLPTLPFYLVMHQDLRTVPRVRAVADALAQGFAEESAQQANAEARWQRATQKR